MIRFRVTSMCITKAAKRRFLFMTKTEEAFGKRMVLPSVGRSFQMVLVEEVLGFRFDEGNGEDEEDEETEEIEQNEESVTGSGDFTSGDEDTIV